MLLRRVQAARARLQNEGPARTRAVEGDFERVSLPWQECNALRDALMVEKASVVIEVGLAYGSSALAIAEAILSTNAESAYHVVIDPFQESEYLNVGWEALCAAGLDTHARLMLEASSSALPKLLADGFTADAAFVDGSHRFHEVFVDLYFLRKLVRPAGLVILDDVGWPSVATAARYYELNLGWRRLELTERLGAWRLPRIPFEPAFTDFKPFDGVAHLAAQPCRPGQATS